MKIAMLGSGGVGGYFGAGLVRGGADVHFIARGAHLAAMRERGLTIEGSIDTVGPKFLFVESTDRNIVI